MGFVLDISELLKNQTCMQVVRRRQLFYKFLAKLANGWNASSEVHSKMIFMGHQISSCHVLVARSFLIFSRPCYHLEILHMITFHCILISPSSIPKSNLVLSHNSSCDDPISTSPVPKSHIGMSHNSSCYDPISTSPVPKSHIVMSHYSS